MNWSLIERSSDNSDKSITSKSILTSPPQWFQNVKVCVCVCVFVGREEREINRDKVLGEKDGLKFKT